MSQYITGFMVSDEAHAYLADMVKSGLYGENLDEVATFLVYRGVQDAIASTVIARHDLPEVEEVEECVAQAPAPEQPPPRFKIKCETCQDGLLNSRKCEHCGAEPEIPF